MSPKRPFVEPLRRSQILKEQFQADQAGVDVSHGYLGCNEIMRAVAGTHSVHGKRTQPWRAGLTNSTASRATYQEECEPLLTQTGRLRNADFTRVLR